MRWDGEFGSNSSTAGKDMARECHRIHRPMRSLRVLSLTPNDSSFYRGQLRSLEDAGVDVTTRTVPGAHLATEDDVQPRTPLAYLRFAASVFRESGDAYDVIHVNYGLLAPIAAAHLRKPTVCSLWGGEFIGNQFAPLIRHSLRAIDEVVVPSSAMLPRLPQAVDATVIPFPVDTDRFRPIPQADARRHLGWDQNESVVLFPAAPSRYEKNYPRAERIVEGLDRDVRLRTTSNRPHEEMPYYMNASDAVLITSRWEAGPMVLKEAVACNVPVVSLDVGFAAETLRGVSNAAVAEDDAELRTALEAVLDRNERSDGRSTLTDYGHGEMAERLVAVYDRAID